MPLLKTESGAVGTYVQGKVVAEMPLKGRNTMDLIALAPGVVTGMNTSGSAALNGSVWRLGRARLSKFGIGCVWYDPMQMK